jgi:ABC-type anion transport system duplicated permease subunit
MDQAASAAQSTALQYGVLGVVALAFAFAIIQLFKTMRADHATAKTDEKAMEKERGQWALEREALQKQWALEREALRTEYERKHREVVESYADAARDERESNRVHEDLVRKEFSDVMERVAAEGGRASQALVDMMQKFYDRFVGPASRGR